MRTLPDNLEAVLYPIIFCLYWLQRHRANGIPVIGRLFIAAVRIFNDNVIKELFTKVRIHIVIAVNLYKIAIARKSKQVHGWINHLLLYHPGIANGYILLVYFKRIQQLHLLFLQYSQLHTVNAPAILNNIDIATKGWLVGALGNNKDMVNH